MTETQKDTLVTLSTVIFLGASLGASAGFLIYILVWMAMECSCA